MSDRLIRRALRVVPLETRLTEGEAVRDMAVDMVESGASSEFKEARGIVAYGLKKRAGFEFEWARGLPWAAALWSMALPIASVQLALLLTSVSALNGYPGGGALATALWIAIGAFSIVSMYGGAARNRTWLAVGAIGTLSALLLDLGLSAGSSYVFAADLNIADTRITTYGSLVLIPTTLMLVAAAFTTPVRLDPAYSWRSVLTTCSFVLLPVYVALDSIADNGMGANQLDVMSLFLGLVMAVLYLATTSLWYGKTERGVAAGMLIVSQSPMLALLFATVTMHAINLPDSFQFGVGVTCIALAVGFVLALAAARKLVRNVA
jgi:hypothetical protein